jgi:deoxyribonuclease-4
MTSTIRVRQLLSALNPVERTALKKLLPAKLTVPEEPEGTKYPAALLSQLSEAEHGEQYSLAGFITEDLLHYTPAEITTATLLATARNRCPALTPIHEEKIAKSKTTEPYLAHLRETRKKIRAATASLSPFRYEEEIGSPGPVRGHPDMRTDTKIFEIKMTGRLKENWQDFLYQVFAYAALAPEVTDIYLVLPLQEIVWHHPVTTWTKRSEYRAFLTDAATKKQSATGPAISLIEAHAIGFHQPKLKSLVDTVLSIPSGKPAQIFLAGPQSSRMNISKEELDATAVAILETGATLFIHSQYLINLCTAATEANAEFHTKLLIKNLQYGVLIGAKGVVVHVGKSTTQSMEAALATMRMNLKEAMEHATADCPILLETPAGQGTEVLTTWAEFAAFVADINDPRLRICIDTCHVFAAGEQPLTYITAMTDKHPALTHLIHFNDSATPCGSCLDRHAAIGEGHIGYDTMKQIAEKATAKEIPMVIE